MRLRFPGFLAFAMVAVAGLAGCGSSSSTGSNNNQTPLSVTSVTPASGATGVAVNTTVTATFNEAIPSSDLTTGSFTLASSGGTAVSGAIGWSSSTNTGTFTPSANLAYSTTYTATLTTGTGLASSYSWSFTTAAAPVPPTVTSTTPANGATGVSVSSAVTATFSQAMTASSLTASTFTLTSAGGAVAGTVTYSSGNNTATFTPSASLAYGTIYTATITTGAVDSTGTALAANDTWTFTTGATPPTVSAETPTPNATGVSVATTITATFSEAMEASTLTASSFTVTDSSGNAVAGSVSYSTSDNTATFTPAANLAFDAAYTATISTAATSSAGVALASGFQWQFTTAATPPAPTVTGVTPANGATDVSVSTTVTAVFSEAMNASTISNSTFTVYGGGSVPGTVAYDAATNTATFTSQGKLQSGATYTVTITTGAASSGGQALAANYSWSFTTAAAPAVTAVTPANGATGVSVNADVTATFSEAMNPATLTASTFTLSSSSGSVTGAVTYSGNTATFTPAAALSQGVVYTATVTTGAQNSGGGALAANYSWSFTTEATASGMVTVDYGTQEQVIRGFGGSTAWLGQLTQAQANELFSPDTGLGLSILRVRIDPTGSASSSPAWVPADGNWLQEATNASEAHEANTNAIVFATPWTPPASLKTSSSSEPYDGSCSLAQGFCGGYLDPANYAAYASYLEDFVTYFNANSAIPLYAISMQNEPDAYDVGYESCYWTAASATDRYTDTAGSAMDTWIAQNASGVTALTRLIMPESENFNPDFGYDALADTTGAEPLISIVGGHLYGGPPSYYTQAENAGKDVWMTEHYLSPSGSNPTIADALAAAEEVHNSMVTGQYNAYVWWWIWDDPNDGINYGLINSSTASPAPTYYGYAIGQFSKFVQPGYNRYNATAAPYNNVFVSAYSGVDSGTGDTHYVIVAINANNTPISQPITIDNATVTSMTPWQTSASGGLLQQTAVTVTNGTFTYVLPAQSITTFVQ